jgi:Polyketide cyclase / dehydrase and lipid transport
MKTWTTEMWLAGMPDEILELLTEPDAIARWAPLAFELVSSDGERLRAGSHARVRGGLAGRQVEFDVEIYEADDGRLSLVATGPVSIDAEYVLRAAGSGSEVRASVSVHGRGLLGGLLARTLDTLLAAGALHASVARLGEELQFAA